MGPSLTHSLDYRRENDHFSSVIVGIIIASKSGTFVVLREVGWDLP